MRPWRAGLAADHPVTVAAKQVRLELLKVKADLERELGTWVLDCKACGMEVHWVQGISMADPGHWGHRFPAPHGEPSGLASAIYTLGPCHAYMERWKCSRVGWS